MALVKCPECGGMISEKAEKCPHCGAILKKDMITCPECGQEIPADSKVCPNCAYPIEKLASEPNSQHAIKSEYSVAATAKSPANTSSSQEPTEKVIIHGYTETYAASPSVSVYMDGQYVGEVSYAGTLTLEVKHDCTLKFTCSIRSTSIEIRKGIDTHIFLSFDRMWGSLKAIAANNENVYQVATQKNIKSRNTTIISIVFIILLFILWMLIR